MHVVQDGRVVILNLIKMLSILARELQVNKFKKENNLKMCILYMIAGSLVFITSGCYHHAYYDDEVIVPHDRAYADHAPASVYTYRAPTYRHYSYQYHSPRRHHRSYRHRSHHRSQRYKRYKRYQSRKAQPRKARVVRRTVTRHYNSQGKLRRRVIRRRYR